MNHYKIRSKTFSIVSEALPEEYSCTSPRMAGPVLRGIFDTLGLDQSNEHFMVVCLNAKGKVIGHKVVSSGMETACLVNPAAVFRTALVLGGTSVLVAHNHPSGDPAPSREDTALTAKLRAAGEMLGLTLADHIVLGEGDRQHSFRA